MGETCDFCDDCGTCGCQLGADECVGCAEVVTFPECFNETALCRGSQQMLDALNICACEACPAECGPNLCSGSAADTPCATCVSSSSQCQRAISACVNDLSD
jgi:hypothetical protein